jgi:hypothetical protein
MVDSTLLYLLLAGGLAVKLFIEGEDSTLRGLADVASSTTTAAELSVWCWEAGIKKRCWAASSAAVGGLWGLEGVTGAATSRVDESVGGWVWLDDLDTSRHF